MDKYDIKTIGWITTFEKVTHSRVKTVFVDKNNQTVFVVNEGDAGKAIGREGTNIRRLCQLLKKKIKVIEFNPDVKEFIKNCIAPLQVDNIVVEDKKVILHSRSQQTRARLIGRNKENLQELNSLVKKYFDVKISVEQ